MAIQDKMKILILDDEKQFTEELNGFFLSSNFESFEANTAEQGKKILSNNSLFLFWLNLH